MANDRSLTSTREGLLDAALERFSRGGYGGTSIRDLARAVGIRESSVYRHFPSKQAIFDALIARADERLGRLGASLGVDLTSPDASAPAYVGISEQHLAELAFAFFDAVLHDPELAALRRMLMVEQYRDPEVGRRLRDYFVGEPLRFQAALFERLQATGDFRDGLDPRTTALAFFGPIIALLQLAESGDEAEDEARDLLVGHVHHFLVVHRRADS